VCPHPDKLEKGGEDAVVLSPLFLGLADGVGGWADSGVNSGDYSRGLMKNAGIKAKEIINTITAPTNNNNNSYKNSSNIVEDILDYAQHKTETLGSSTAIMVALSPIHGKPHFHVGNVGDSFALILRPHPDSRAYLPVLKTSEQSHFFNCPFQLSQIPSPSSSSSRGPSICDRANAGQYLLSEAMAGDLIILGSDGLLDNLFLTNIVGICQNALTSAGLHKEQDFQNATQIEETLSLIASRLARSAQQASKRTDVVSPFALEAKLNGYEYLGGKPDDISVVAGFVVPS